MPQGGDLFHYEPCQDTVALECTRLFTLDGIRQPLVSTMTATSVIMELSSPAKRKKSGSEDLTGQAAVNARLPGGPWSQLSHSFAPDQQWRQLPDGSILELRKEKSRDAARSRRGKENYEFYELAKMLPLPPAITSQLDKASIIRLTISYLKLREFTLHGDPPWPRDMSNNKSLKGTNIRPRTMSGMTMDIFENHQGTHVLQSLDGFAFTLAADGRFLYISETVSIYLGLSQVEMTGSSVFDYIHQQDHQELADQLGLTLATGQPLPSPSSLGSEEGATGSQGTMNPDVATCMSLGANSQFKGYDRAFCIRMKSTLTKRGCHFKTSGYRVVLVLGHLRPQYVFSHSRKSTPQLMGLVALAIALPPPSVHEVRLESDMFVTRLNFDFRIAHCEPKVADLLDYAAEELQGRSLYSLCHGQDVERLRKTHIDLIQKGQVMSPYFRLLNKTGGYTWVQICATVVVNNKNGDEQNIICVNYVISRAEYESLVLDQTQLDPALANMKSDDLEYPNAATPEPREGGSRAVSEDTGGSPRPAVSTSGGGGGDTRSPMGQTESITTPLRGTPSVPLDGAQIKTEATGGLLTPMGNADLPEDSSGGCERTSSPGHISEPPASTPGTPHARATPMMTTTPIEASPGANVPPPPHNDEGAVRNLEAAMTRHLPDDTTDFSTDALLKGGATSTSMNNAGQRSTIQWVGNASAQQTSALPASTLLRQLYASRESVIRSSVQRSYYSEMGSALPTPPGSEGYQDAMFGKGHDFPYPGSGLTASGYPDYHSAMTPPSSVSPREKMAGDCGDLRGASAGYLGDGGGLPAQPVPLKPQVYSYGSSGVPLDSSAYSAPLSDQAGLYTPSSFHLYHANSTKSTSSYDSLRTGGSWYAPSS
ncbi:protein trachealess-like isoform X8 [Portunus trituberculatus]|uniref:protein trachealess-like isoform X8 n=1 Tax=Portunus trituberculatus TaxID=210409 RepID=UPI001E1CD5EB|nr:protein trachealess-like isoform X8 [Portunus trituberculatus]